VLLCLRFFYPLCRCWCSCGCKHGVGNHQQPADFLPSSGFQLKVPYSVKFSPFNITLLSTQPQSINPNFILSQLWKILTSFIRFLFRHSF
jgi:hypothetical protein